MLCLHPSNCSDPKSRSHLWLLSLINPSNLLWILLTLSSKSIQNLTAFHHSIIMTLVWTTILSYRLLQYSPNRSPWFYPYFPTAYFQHRSWNDVFKICHFSPQNPQLLYWFYMIWPPITPLISYTLLLVHVSVSSQVLRCSRCSPVPGPLLPYFCCLKHSCSGCLLGWLPL